jgi:DNA-binding LytR/AlgR family response regulator
MAVIFTTGYDQHALAAFGANALAYRLKPIEAERLSVAMPASAWSLERPFRPAVGNIEEIRFKEMRHNPPLNY